MQLLSKLDVPNWLVYTGLGLMALYVYGMWPYRYWRNRGIKQPRMLPLFGNLIDFMRTGFMKVMMENARRYGKVHGTYMMRQPALVIGDPEMVKQVCIKKAESFIDRGTIGNETKPFDKGILALKGQEWKRVRSILTPSFSSGKIKAMYPLIEDCSDQLCRALLKAEKQPVDIKAYCMNFTMDAVARTLFGLKINTQEDPNNEFKTHANSLFSFSFASPKVWLLFLFPSIVIPIYKKLDITLFSKESMDFFQRIIANALKEREASAESDMYNDFLASMVTARKEAERQGAKGLTEHEVMAQSLIFFLAGFETTSNALMYLMYFLAMNPGVQERAHREVAAAVQRHGQLTYDSIKELQFLNQCFDETLRMCPPALLADRLCTETTTVNGYEIEKGIVVHIPIYFLAHDPDLWDEPERFNPDRFGEDSAQARDPAHLIPFGMGPRNCIGMRLAQLEIRRAMAEMLLRLRFSPAESTPTYEKMQFKPAGMMVPKDPIVLHVLPRQ